MLGCSRKKRRSAEPWSAPADFPPPASKRAPKAASDQVAKRLPERLLEPQPEQQSEERPERHAGSPARPLPRRRSRATSAFGLLRDCSQVPRINIWWRYVSIQTLPGSEDPSNQGGITYFNLSHI